MRPLEKFRKEKKYSYVKLHKWLQSKGIIVPKNTMYCWCREGETARFPRREIIPKLSKVTKISQKQFWNDYDNRKNGFVGEINGE